MDADGRNRVQLTSDKAHDSWPAIVRGNVSSDVVLVSEQ
jgi:hypothetical protein